MGILSDPVAKSDLWTHRFIVCWDQEAFSLISGFCHLSILTLRTRHASFQNTPCFRSVHPIWKELCHSVPQGGTGWHVLNHEQVYLITYIYYCSNLFKSFKLTRLAGWLSTSPQRKGKKKSPWYSVNIYFLEKCISDNNIFVIHSWTAPYHFDLSHTKTIRWHWPFIICLLRLKFPQRLTTGKSPFINKVSHRLYSGFTWSCSYKTLIFICIDILSIISS